MLVKQFWVSFWRWSV